MRRFPAARQIRSVELSCGTVGSPLCPENPLLGVRSRVSEKGLPVSGSDAAQRAVYGRVGYFVPVARDRRDNFLVTAGLSGVLGYETVNRGGKRLYDGATLVSGNGFVYGGEIALRGEAYLCDRVALLLTLRERVTGGSSVARFHTLLVNREFHALDDMPGSTGAIRCGRCLPCDIAACRTKTPRYGSSSGIISDSRPN